MSKSKQARQERQRKELEVRKILRAFVWELRKILKRVGPGVYRRCPNMRRPCSTCAFNPSTDSWQGADATAFNLHEAISKDQVFYCHENMQKGPGGWDPSTAPELLPCAGWMAIVGEPETRTAFLRAALGPNKPLTDELANLLVRKAVPS